jgi:hypothetical protein
MFISMAEQVQKRLPALKLLLQTLPPDPAIPYSNNIYNFASFELDPAEILNYGKEGTLNRALEIVFGSQHAGVLQFRECSPGLTAIVDLFGGYIKQFLENAILHKWVEDLKLSAKTHHKNYKQSVSILKN